MYLKSVNSCFHKLLLFLFILKTKSEYQKTINTAFLMTACLLPSLLKDIILYVVDYFKVQLVMAVRLR